jgi:hypothetical protein
MGTPKSLPQRVKLRKRKLRRAIRRIDPRAARLQTQVIPITIARLARLQPNLGIRLRASDNHIVTERRIARLRRENTRLVSNDQLSVVYVDG